MGKIWKCEKRLFKDHWIKNIRSTHKLQITDGSVPGLYMRYSPTTKLVTFFLACLIRSTGERKNIYLGRYTEYETVEDVKKKARGLREQILLGGNPMAQIKEIRCLKVREVDLEHKVLHLEDSKTGAWAEEHHFFIVRVPDDMELNFCEKRPEEISVAWVDHNDLLNPKITPFDDMRRFFEQYLLPKFLDF